MQCYTNQPNMETLMKWHECGEVSNGLLHLCDVLAQMSTRARELADGTACMIDFDQMIIELENRFPTTNIVRILGDMCIDEDIKNSEKEHETMTVYQTELF